MKLTYNWLKDFVDIKLKPQQLADKLTMAGLEVKSIENFGGDSVFEIEITSNRPDWLSVIGVAREVAAITGKKIKDVQGSRFKVQRKKQNPSTFNLQPATVSIIVEDKKDCPLYTAKLIRNVSVGPSPDWLKRRLEAIGCRSINNIVDITNYVLFTYGEPLHAFDFDKLFSHQSPVTSRRSPVVGHQSEIIIRRAKDNEKIITIDEKERILSPDVLIIASEDGTTGDRRPGTGDRRPQTGKPVAVAGVMGGLDTEVSFNTKNILLEAAVFNPVLIRRSRQRIALQTDSSYRFERGLDLETALNASSIALNLIQAIASGECAFEKNVGSLPKQKKTLYFSPSCTEKLIGVKINAQDSKKMLTSLGFKIKPKGKANLEVEVPFFRQDVTCKEDLIEELSRVFGYEHIQTSIPCIKPKLKSSMLWDLTVLLKNTLANLGLNEAITYSLIDKNVLNKFRQSSEMGDVLEIQNPLSKEQEILRPTILPSLIKSVANNINQKQEYINLFEVAKIYSKTELGTPQERLVLGIALCGEKSILLENGKIKEEAGFLQLKGIIEQVFLKLGLTEYAFSFKQNDNMVELFLQQEKIGSLLKVNKSFLGFLDIKNKQIFVTEIILEKVLQKTNLHKVFKPLSQFPAIVRDISVVLKKDLAIDEIFITMKKEGGTFLEEVKIVDIYKGKQIADGFKALTISCLYRSKERTLTEDEITPIQSALLKLLTDKFQAQIR